MGLTEDGLPVWFVFENFDRPDSMTLIPSVVLIDQRPSGAVPVTGSEDTGHAGSLEVQSTESSDYEAFGDSGRANTCDVPKAD